MILSRKMPFTVKDRAPRDLGEPSEFGPVWAAYMNESYEVEGLVDALRYHVRRAMARSGQAHDVRVTLTMDVTS